MSTIPLIKLRKINPIQYRKLPALNLKYGTSPTKFGNCLAAFKENVLCFLTFYEREPPLEVLRKTWANAIITEDQSLIADRIKKLFTGNTATLEIYLKGTDFEIEVWEALLNVKKGTTASYQDVAIALGRAKAVRAVGRAVAKNNVAYFIPCHRIIKKDGSLHKYGSGPERKSQMLQDEGAM